MWALGIVWRLHNAIKYSGSPSVCFTRLHMWPRFHGSMRGSYLQPLTLVSDKKKEEEEEEKEEKRHSTGIKKARLSSSCPEDSPADSQVASLARVPPNPNPAPSAAAWEIESNVFVFFLKTGHAAIPNKTDVLVITKEGRMDMRQELAISTMPVVFSVNYRDT